MKNNIEKPNKILYFASSKGIGFTSHYLDLAKNIEPKEQFVFISGETAQSDGTFEELDSLKVLRATIPKLDTAKDIINHLKSLKYLTKELKPYAIHTQTNYQLLLASILKPFSGYKVIQTIHAFNNGRGGLPMLINKAYLTITCLIFADKVIFQSDFVRKNFPLLKNKSAMLPLGFQAQEPIRKAYKNAPKRIIYTAKFHAAKNHEWLINTLEPLLRSEKVTLTLPGDGEQLERIKNLIRKKCLTPYVFTPGWVSRKNITELYQESDLAVVPSRSETLGHNIIEPLAYGVPVVSFPVGIAPDIAEKSCAVQIVPFYDSETMLSAVENTLKDPLYHSKLSKSAQDFFEKNLTWSAHIKSYKKILEKL